MAAKKIGDTVQWGTFLNFGGGDCPRLTAVYTTYQRALTNAGKMVESGIPAEFVVVLPLDADRSVVYTLGVAMRQQEPAPLTQESLDKTEAQ
jgi:hypothetical protein